MFSSSPLDCSLLPFPPQGCLCHSVIFSSAIRRYESDFSFFETVTSQIFFNSYKLENRSLRLQHLSGVTSIIEEIPPYFPTQSLYPIDLCTTCSFLAHYLINPYAQWCIPLCSKDTCQSCCRKFIRGIVHFLETALLRNEIFSLLQ